LRQNSLTAIKEHEFQSHRLKSPALKMTALRDDPSGYEDTVLNNSEGNPQND